MAASLTLSIQPTTLEVQAGQETESYITIQNNGHTVGQYDVRVQEFDPAWISIEPQQFSLFPGEETHVTVRLHPPNDALAKSYPVIIGVIDQGEMPNEEWLILDLTVQGKVTTSAQLEPPTLTSTLAIPVQASSSGKTLIELTADRRGLTLAAGTEGQINLMLRNAEGVSLLLDLMVQGIPPEWYAITPPSITLAANQASNAQLTLAPPADAPLGSYPLSIHAQSPEQPEESSQLNLILEIAEAKTLTVRLRPPQAEGAGSAQIEVQVQQTGHLPLPVKLSAHDQSGWGHYTFQPATFTLPPGGHASSQLTIRSRSPLTEGITYPFTVTATASQAEGQSQGQFVPRPTPPIGLDLTPRRQVGSEQATYTIRLTNPSQTAQTIHLDASDRFGACSYQFDPPIANIPPLSTSQSTLTVTPQQYHRDERERIHRFAVRASSADGQLQPAQVEGDYAQRGMALPVLTLNPTSQSHAQQATYTLQISNPHLVPLEIDFQANDTNGVCEFSINPPRLSLRPRTEGMVKITVRSTASLLAGETRRTHDFTVYGQASTLEEPVMAQGSLIQIPGRRLLPWLLLLMGIFLLFCLTGLFFQQNIRGLLFAGSTESTATAAPSTAVPPTTESSTAESSTTESPTIAAPTTESSTAASPTVAQPTVDLPTPEPDGPTLSNFAACATPCLGDFSNAARTFGQNTAEIYVQWDYQKLPPGSSYVREWTVNEQLYVRYQCNWDGAEAGRAEVRLFPPQGSQLISGQWKLRVIVDGEIQLDENLEVQGDTAYYSLDEPVRNRCFD